MKLNGKYIKEEDDGVFLPTEKEIIAKTIEIQLKWSDNELKKRQGSHKVTPVFVTESSPVPENGRSIEVNQYDC